MKTKLIFILFGLIALSAKAQTNCTFFIHYDPIGVPYASYIADPVTNDVLLWNGTDYVGAPLGMVAYTNNYTDLLGKPAIGTVIQSTRAQTDASGNLTWTYPNAYAGGVVPHISVVGEGGSTVPLNFQIVGVPTNTSVTIKVISLPSTSVLGIAVLGAPTGTQAYVHIYAKDP